MNVDVKKLSEEVSKNGFSIVRNVCDVQKAIKEIEKLEEHYCESMVEKEFFKPAEDYEGRHGGACLVSKTSDCDSKCSTLFIDNFLELQRMYNIFQDFLKINTQDFKEEPVLLNWQQYKQGSDNSLPWHIDVDIKDGQWAKEEISIHRGIIPKYVMVIVSANDNDGQGLKVKIHKEDFENAGIGIPVEDCSIVENSVYEIDVELNPGDLLIFDNTILLHGVPESLPNYRSMFGFRSFNQNALLFSEEEMENSKPFKVGDYIKGFVKTPSLEEKEKYTFGFNNG